MIKHNYLILIMLFTTTFFSQKSDFNHIDFSKADSIANQYHKASLKNLAILTNKLTRGLNTDVEKFRAMYLWVSKNIKSDQNATHKILRKGKKLRNNRKAFITWNNTHKEKTLEKLISQKTTICTGYAFLLRELCRLANIECKIINGYYKSHDFDKDKPFPNHSWNAVLLNNKWYLCDATLASGYYFTNENIFIFDYNDGYFLTAPELFVQNHFPENTKWTLLPKSSLNFTEFVESPFVYSDTFKHRIAPIQPTELVFKTDTNTTVSFKLIVDEFDTIDKLTLVSSNGWKVSQNKLEDYQYTNGILKFNHQFSKKGLYDFHITADNSPVVTYTIEVN